MSRLMDVSYPTFSGRIETNSKLTRARQASRSIVLVPFEEDHEIGDDGASGMRYMLRSRSGVVSRLSFSNILP